MKLAYNPLLINYLLMEIRIQRKQQKILVNVDKSVSNASTALLDAKYILMEHTFEQVSLLGELREIFSHKGR